MTGIRFAAAASALVSAVVHAVLVPEHLEEVPYIGWLFLIGTVLLLLTVVALLLRPWRLAGWWLGSVVSAGMIGAYVLSRTVGLPQGYQEEWGDVTGTISLIVEAIFLVAAAATAAHGRRAARAVPT